MHDPMTVAFEINLPLPWKTNGLLKSDGRVCAKYHLATIWHVDPEKDGTDDSCGWFKRARHGDDEVLEKIVKRFELDWDRVFETKKEDHDSDDGAFRKQVYFCGLFCPNGDPHMSVSGIVLNLFYSAAMVYFESDGRSNWAKAKRFMNRHLFDILIFAENPTDSLFDGITRKFEIGCQEKYDKRSRDERIRNMASCIYAWIMRAEQRWWQHPRWHVHHWKLQVPFLQQLKRRFVERCSVCGKGFRFNESCCSDWNGTRIWHDRCASVSAKPVATEK